MLLLQQEKKERKKPTTCNLYSKDKNVTEKSRENG
jgi:hypothetical protein